MADLCGNCKAVGNGKEEMVPCSGVCHKLYHLKCANINITTYNNLIKNKQLRWYCLDCSNINLFAIINKLDVLSSNLAKLTSGFADVAALLKNSLAQDSGIINKFINSNNSVNSYANAIVSEMDSLQIVGDTYGVAEPDPFIVPVVPSEKLNYLYISHLSPSTSTDNVTSFLNKKLELEDNLKLISIRSLVAKDKNLSELSFISFKIGLPPTLYNKVLCGSFWPAGVLVRPFVDKRRSKNLANLFHTKAD